MPRTADRKRDWGSIGAVGWVVLVSSLYFAAHKPVTRDQIEALERAGGGMVSAFRGIRLEAVGRSAGALLGAVATSGVATVLGGPWVRGLSELDDRTRLALRLGAGLVLLGYLVLVLSAVGAHSQWLGWGLAALSAPLALRTWARHRRSVLPRLPVRRSDRWLAAFVIGMVGIAIGSALAPPTAWDALVYHLTGPRLYLEAGRLQHAVDLPYLGFPAAGSMLFLWGLSLANDRVPQLLHVGFGLLTLALLPWVVRRVAPGRSWLAAAILMAVPSAQLLLGWAYVDWIAAFAGLASLILLTADGEVDPDAVRERASRAPGNRSTVEWKRFALAGAFAALALNTKYTTIWIVVGLSAAAIVQRRTWREVAVFGASTLLCAAPYLAKNWLLTGNPVYPFFISGVYWDSFRAAWFSRGGTGLGIGSLFLAPWDATIWGLEGGYFEGHPSYGATIGPILLSLLPLGLLRSRRPAAGRGRAGTALLWLCGVSYLGWVAQLAYSQLLVQTRLLFPVLPGLAVGAAYGLDRLGARGRGGRSARFVIGGLIGFALLLTGLQASLGFVAASPLGVLTGSQSEADYRVERLGGHAAAMELLGALPEGSRVRFLWEPRSYYCPAQVTCEPDALLDRWWHARQLGGTAEDLRAAWSQEGVTHVLYFRLGSEAVRQVGFDPLVESDWQELERFLGEELILIERVGTAYELYRLPG